MNRSAMVWITVVIMIAIGMMIWFITQPIVSIISSSMLTSARTVGTNTTTVEQGMSIIDGVNVVWIVVYIISWVLFGFLFGTRKEGEGSYYTTSRF